MSTADPDLGGFPQDWGFNCLVHFASRYEWVTFWIHIWPVTENSKPDSPYQIAYLRSGASGLRSERLHGIGIVVWSKWMKCVTKTQSLLASTPHKSQTITLVTVHDFVFQLSMMSPTHVGDFATMKMEAPATASRTHDSKHQSNHCRTKQAASSQILMWRCKWIVNWYFGA